MLEYDNDDDDESPLNTKKQLNLKNREDNVFFKRNT